MTVIAAIIDREADEDQVVARLSGLNIDGLDWRVYRPEEDTERILPAARLDGSVTPGGAVQGVGLPFHVGVRDDIALESRGIPQDEADFYAQSHAHGATIIVVDTPSDFAGDVRLALEGAGAMKLSAE